MQMTKLDGFDVLELIGTEVPLTFVMAYDRVTPSRRPAARRRLPLPAVRRRVAGRGVDAGPGADRRARSPAGKGARFRTRTAPLERILICEKADAHVIPVAKIDDFESQDDYVSLKDGDKRR